MLAEELQGSSVFIGWQDHDRKISIFFGIGNCSKKIRCVFHALSICIFIQITNHIYE